MHDFGDTNGATAIAVVGSSNVTIQGNDIYNANHDGIDLWNNVSNITIQYNHMHDFSQPPGNTDHIDAIQSYGAAGTSANNVTLRGNYFHVSVDEGILFSDRPSYNLTIEDNVFVGNGAWDMMLSQVTGATIEHNTMCALVMNYPSDTNITLLNNIFVCAVEFYPNSDTNMSAFSSYGYNLSLFSSCPWCGYTPASTDIDGNATFTGGASPSSWAGFQLTSSSPGYHAASDGLDMGATYYGGTYTPPPSPAPDTTAPSVPTSLATTSVTSSSVALGWSASTDPTVSGQTTSGLAGYKVYRCSGSSCTPSTQIGDSVTSGTTYTDSSVSASTQYIYTVSAYDNASPANESNKSSSISVTTPASSSNNNNSNNNPPASTPTPTQTPSGGGGGGSSYTSPSPIISSVSTTPVGNTSMTITWSTSLPATSQVLYGLTSVYGSQTSLNSALVTSHSVTISNLQANTTYHFKILSTASGSNAPTSDLTFTTGKSGTPILPVTSPVTTPTVTSIPTTLLTIPFGTRSSSVVTLQNQLIALGFLTPGLNTGYYGTLTQTAVTKYRASITTASPTTQPPISQLPTSSSQFTRTLKLGSIGPDVKQLQVFLNNHGYIIASTGNGSSGHETTYYGPATAAAVSRFQLAHFSTILAPYGLTQGTGNFGSATMRVVNGMK